MRRRRLPAARGGRAHRVARSRRPRHRGTGLGDALVAVLRRLRHGWHRRACRGDRGGEREHAGRARAWRLRRRRHRRPAAGRLRRRGHARARPPRRRAEGRGSRRGSALPARAHDRRGRQRHRAAPPGGPSAPAGGRGRCRRGGRRRRARPPPPGGRGPADRRRDPAGRHRSRPGRDPRHELAHARGAGRSSGLRGVAQRDPPRRPRDHRRRRARRRDACGPRRHRCRVERRARRLHGEHRRAVGDAGGPRRGGASWPPGRPRRGRRHARPRSAGLSRLRCADVRHLRRPAAVVPGGRGAGRAAARPGEGRAQARLADGDGRLGARAARSRRRRPRRDAAAARRRRADVARAGGRSPRRARGVGGPSRG